jgi:glycosyltransferase involved in cell wall biosynthesis
MLIKDTNRVLMLTPFYQTQRGNTLTVERLRRGLTWRGFSIEVLSMEQPGWISFLQAAVQEPRYALLHGFHGLYFGQALELVPQINQLPLLLTTTGTDLNLDLYGSNRSVVMKALCAAQRIIVFNEDSRKKIVEVEVKFEVEVKAGSGLNDKLVTIPQGVSLEGNRIRKRSEFGLADDNIVFLLPSGLRAVKNIEMALDGLEKVHKEFPEVRLLIIGVIIEPQYADSIQRRIRKLPWISYLGEIPHKEMREILSLGDIVINTSISEGQPQGALEAMSLGKPAILSAVPGNLNLLTHGVEGFYQRNEDELISAAKALIVNRELREDMGQDAKKMVEIKFAVEKEWEAYAEVYWDLLS